MKRHYVEKQFTLQAYFFYSLYVLILLFFLATFINSLGEAYVALGVLVYIFAATFASYVAIQFFRRRRILKKRAASLDALATANGWKFHERHMIPEEFSLGSLYMVADREISITNYIKTPEWSSMDLSYAVYQQTKYGEFKQSTVHYAVMSIELPRALPNVVFDSKRAHGKQYKRIFADGQLHSLEGNFDTFFATYFIKDYTIDSLSFITPEVMHVLIDASEYDIEIIGNRLVLSGPVYDAEQQIEDMSTKLGAIKKKLLNNILTYRDERLPFVEGRTAVAPEGMRLKRREVSIWVGVAIVTVYVLYGVSKAVLESL